MNVFTARYGGACAVGCASRIQPGDDVTYTADDELVHADCTPREQREAPVCPSCWLAHAGECM